MTDRKMLEELASIIMKSEKFVSGTHVYPTKNIQFYMNGGDEKNSIGESFFAIKAFGFDVRHYSYCMSVESEVDTQFINFRQFKFNSWAAKVEKELKESQETITLNGKKYRLVEGEEA